MTKTWIGQDFLDPECRFLQQLGSMPKIIALRAISNLQLQPRREEHRVSQTSTRRIAESFQSSPSRKNTRLTLSFSADFFLTWTTKLLKDS